MKHVAFLSMGDLGDFFVYDDLLIPHFTSAGWQVTSVPWREKTNWNDYDAVIVRSPWDYQQSPAAFLSCLRDIEASRAYLDNPLALMEWNLQKTYLKDMAAQGVITLPTRWDTGYNLASVSACFCDYDTDELIVKPTLSANADDTFRLTAEDANTREDELCQLYADRGIMIQPFVKEVLLEGEYSLFYFNGKYSHAILKTPKQGDFRVQEEHGGALQSVTPDASMQKACEHALASMPTDSLYARVDLIRYQSQWAVMELELIEPSLYFNLDDASQPRFVNAFLTRYAAYQDQ
ncbi:ATP-grasp domain-containing protein [Alteromonas sp. H39]|uniref:ATP-grasp domain-containing protein n=1 Tax=Alteromonas sp. H39 TaxID=3389876 RepID=UPI0039E131A6